MYLCLCEYIYIYACMCMYVCLHIYICVCVSVYIYVCMCVYVCIFLCVSECICECVWLHVCVRVCMCISVFIAVCVCVGGVCVPVETPRIDIILYYFLLCFWDKIFEWFGTHWIFLIGWLRTNMIQLTQPFIYGGVTGVNPYIRMPGKSIGI